jgi:hypothetical protein
MRKSILARGGLLIVAGLSLASCGLLLGIPSFEDCCDGTNDGACTACGTGGSSGERCTPGDKKKCPYSGKAENLDKGECKAGIQTCDANGAFGACEGEVLPLPKDDCTTPTLDENCDGQLNDGCPCKPTDMTACYDGPKETRGVGLCHDGMAACNKNGMGFGTCMMQVLPATEDCDAKGDEDCDGIACSETEWVVPVSALDLIGVVEDSQGNIVIAGNFGGTIDLGGGPIDSATGNMLVAKLDAHGALIWAKALGGAGSNAVAHAIDVDSTGEIAVGGTFTGTANFGGSTFSTTSVNLDWDAFLFQLDGQGAHKWSNRYGFASNTARADDITALRINPVTHDIWVGGQSGGLIVFGNGSPVSCPSKGAYSGFLVRVAGGAAQSAVCLAYSPAKFPNGNAITSVDVLPMTGEVAIAGTYASGVTVGNVTVANPAKGMFVSKIDSMQNTEWVKGYDTDTLSAQVAITSTGDVIFATSFTGNATIDGQAASSPGSDYNILVAKTPSSGSGAPIWLKNLGDGFDQRLVRLALDPLGNTLITGQFLGSIDLDGSTMTASTIGLYDGFVAKLAPNGGRLWSKAFKSQEAMPNDWAITATSKGHVVMEGVSNGTADFGTGAVTTPGHVLVEFQP